jgi:hypothetical protein
MAQPQWANRLCFRTWGELRPPLRLLARSSSSEVPRSFFIFRHRKLHMYIDPWDEGLRRAVENRRDELGAECGPEYSIRQTAAKRTGGIPVYCDLGGCVAIQPSGAVVTYDLDTEGVGEVVDARWIRAACAWAADQFPEFAALRPRRSPGAFACAACSGSGKTTQLLLRCSTCLGLGWLEQDRLR